MTLVKMITEELVRNLHVMNFSAEYIFYVRTILIL